MIKGARGNNLKEIDVELPLGKFVCVTGVSGSGKSSLINGTLKPILSRELYRAYAQPLEYDSIEGIEHIDKLVVVDQSPIGRTPRSNPATYTAIFQDVRKLFEMTPEAQVRGYKAGRFSFNVKGGRCETCKGAGVQTIEMNFLPDVYVTCKSCGGKRYNKETLEVKYRGKNIGDVLDMTINNVMSEFFEAIPHIRQSSKRCKMWVLVTSPLVSRVQLCREARVSVLSSHPSCRNEIQGVLCISWTNPPRWLHFEDVNMLIGVLNKLVDRGNSVIVIEHNLDVIKVADHLIDVGPEEEAPVAG